MVPRSRRWLPAHRRTATPTCSRYATSGNTGPKRWASIPARCGSPSNAPEPPRRARITVCSPPHSPKSSRPSMSPRCCAPSPSRLVPVPRSSRPGRRPAPSWPTRTSSGSQQACTRPRRCSDSSGASSPSPRPGSTKARRSSRAAIVQHALGRSRELSGEQRTMVQALTTAGHGVDVVVGVAGAGKTQALAAARLAWTAAGYDVRGAALAARAAAELEIRAQIPATSLEALLATLDRSPSQLSARTVVVLDEAAMIGTRKLARLLAHADHAHAKVVLVGDDHQLPEIQAGGAFRGLVHRLPSVRLNENRRQRDPHERHALAELRAGRADRALQHLTSRGRISTTATRTDAHAEIINRWLAARRRRRRRHHARGEACRRAAAQPTSTSCPRRRRPAHPTEPRRSRPPVHCW